MLSITLNRKRLVIYCIFLVVFSCGWVLLRKEMNYNHSPVEVKVEQKNVISRRQPQVDNNLSDGGKEFFVECRLTRDRICSRQIELLKEIAGNPDSSAEVRERAQKDIMQITENLGKETEIEKIIIARGFKDAVVMLQPKMATVVVQAPSLLQSDSERIKEIVSRSTGLEPESVFVIAKP